MKYFAETKPVEPKKNSFSSDSLGIRESLNALGIKNEQIGWDGENVLIDGVQAIKPKRNEAGTTYAGLDDIRKVVDNYYKSKNRNNYVADVTSAVSAQTGISNLVEYGSGGTVSVAGVPIENTWIVDGQAYAPYEDITKAVKTYMDESGVKTPNEVNKAYKEKTEKNAKETEDKINDFKDFSYDAEKDPAYQALKKQYTKNAEKARDDLYGEYAARTGGYGNTAAQAASQQGYYDYMSKLDSFIPELVESAYKRYNDDFERLLKKQEQYGSPKDMYDMEYESAKDFGKNVNDSMKVNYERNKDSRDFSEKKDEFDKEYWLDKNFYENVTLPKERRDAEQFEYEKSIRNLEELLKKSDILSKLANSIQSGYSALKSKGEASGKYGVDTPYWLDEIIYEVINNLD